MAQQDALKVGIIGLEHLHPRLYMPLFDAVEQTDVVAVAETEGDLREAFCRDFGIAGYASCDELLAAEAIDIAAIFLPHADCAAAAEVCAVAGAHLMVEKPMAASAAGAARIVAAARDHGRKLTTGYCWRLHPVAKRLKHLVHDGVIGDVVSAEGRCAAGRLTRYIDGHSPWMLQKARSGGGPMYNLGVHWIDLFHWVFEDDVVEASGQNVKVNADYDIEDNSFAHLRYRGGAIASLNISYTVPDAFPCGRDLYVSVRGTRGVISWSPAYEGEKDVLFICSDQEALAGSPNRQETFELEPVTGYSGFMGLHYIQDFADAIRSDRTPLITGDDGVAALNVVEAIYRSATEKRWVPVS